MIGDSLSDSIRSRMTMTLVFICVQIILQTWVLFRPLLMPSPLTIHTARPPKMGH